MDRYIAYYRVSTEKQERSGLGIEAQKAAVAAFLASAKTYLVSEFTEIESGRVRSRPELHRAINDCKLRNGKLLIARLDRLARDVGLITALRDNGIQFVCCDMPDANSFTINIMASLAEYERELISARVKAALSSAKARGKQLGNPNLHLTRTRTVTAPATRARQAKASRHREGILLAIQSMQPAPFSTVADRLNELGYTTPSGRGRWHATTVLRVVEHRSRDHTDSG